MSRPRTTDDPALRTHAEVAKLLGMTPRNVRYADNRAVEKILTALLTDPEVRQAARDCGMEVK